MTKPPVRLRTPQVAQVLGVSVDTVRRYARNGTLPARRIGGVYQYRLDDVKAYVDAAKIETPAPRGEETPNPNPNQGI